jgi:hypothetical protein
MKRLLPYLFMGLVLLLAVAWLFQQQRRQLDTRFSLSTRQTAPYGSLAAYRLLPSFFPHAVVETNQRPPQKWKTLSLDSSGQVLLIVNSFFHPSEAELDYLTAFAQNGNYVLISTLGMNDTALRFFRVQQPLVYNNTVIPLPGEPALPATGDSLLLSLDSTQFAPPWQYHYPGRSYASYYAAYDSAFTFKMGDQGYRLPALLGIHTRKGSIVLHSAPVAFTNLFVLYGNNYTYLEKILKLGPAGVRKVVWDEYFLRKPLYPSARSRGVLAVLLQYPAFRWAFYSALLLLGIYLFTTVKRKQRMIPVYSRPVNESLAFVTTVGKLYYEKGDHTNLAEKLSQFFLDHVRSRYALQTTVLNRSFVEQLALKSGVPAAEVEAIVQIIHRVQLRGNISAQELMDYYEQLEQFYQKA